MTEDITALRSKARATAEKATPGVWVKPLEWVEYPSFPAESCWFSKQPLCTYDIDQDFGSDAFYYEVRRSGRLVGTYDGLPEAKEAAQADYEAGILSALIVPHGGDPVRLDGGCLYCDADQGENHRPNCAKPRLPANTLSLPDRLDAYQEALEKAEKIVVMSIQRMRAAHVSCMDLTNETEQFLRECSVIRAALEKGEQS